MNALPDFTRTDLLFDHARMVINDAINSCRVIDYCALETAANDLSPSRLETDIIRVRTARNVLWAKTGADLSASDAEMAARIAPGPINKPKDHPHELGRMAQHFETLKPARKRLTEAQKARVAFGIVIAALAIACAVNIALAAPAKNARTVALHQEISQ